MLVGERADPLTRHHSAVASFGDLAHTVGERLCVAGVLGLLVGSARATPRPHRVGEAVAALNCFAGVEVGEGVFSSSFLPNTRIATEYLLFPAILRGEPK